VSDEEQREAEDDAAVLAEHMANCPAKANGEFCAICDLGSY
jgi:hypothetical protein